METRIKVAVVFGVLAFTASTLVAGCGGSATGTASSTASSTAAQIPTSILDGLVKPADVSDDWWSKVTAQLVETEKAMASGSTEDAATYCASTDDKIGNLPEEFAVGAEGGTPDEWRQVLTVAFKNLQAMACAKAGK